MITGTRLLRVYLHHTVIVRSRGAQGGCCCFNIKNNATINFSIDIFMRVCASPSFSVFILSLLCFFRSFSRSSLALSSAYFAFFRSLSTYKTGEKKVGETTEYLFLKAITNILTGMCSIRQNKARPTPPRVFYQAKVELAYQFLGRFLFGLHIFAADFDTLRALSLNRDLRCAMDARL